MKPRSRGVEGPHAEVTGRRRCGARRDTLITSTVSTTTPLYKLPTLGMLIPKPRLPTCRSTRHYHYKTIKDLHLSSAAYNKSLVLWNVSFRLYYATIATMHTFSRFKTKPRNFMDQNVAKRMLLYKIKSNYILQIC